MVLADIMWHRRPCLRDVRLLRLFAAEQHPPNSLITLSLDCTPTEMSACQRGLGPTTSGVGIISA